MGVVDEEETLELLRLLSNDISIDILRALYGKKWCIASAVSRNLGIHTTTAQKYLAKMHEMGLLQRRVRVCSTRRTFEYQLKSPRIRIELDLKGLFQNHRALPKSVYRFYFSLFFALVNGARKIGGSQIDLIVEDNIRRLKAKDNGESLLFLKSLEHCNDVEHSLKYFQRVSLRGRTGASSIRGTFSQLIDGILVSYEAKMGKNATKEIVAVSVDRILRDNAAIVEKYGLLADLPKEYFGFLGGR